LKLRHPAALGCAGLLVLAGIYCLPQHPSSGHAVALDVLAHVALFTGIGLWFGWFVGRSLRVFIALFAFAALLEVAQWRIGGYPRIEWPDILANWAGLVLAVLWLWLRRASAGRT
jgi:VanZ family protein